MNERFRRRNKQNTAFPPLETAVICFTLCVLGFFAVLRFEKAIFLQNQARSSTELNRIFELEQVFYTANGCYGLLDEVGFSERFPFSGIIYSVKVDSTGYVAYAHESAGTDAFGDRRPGNEYLSVDAEGQSGQGKLDVE